MAVPKSDMPEHERTPNSSPEDYGALCGALFDQVRARLVEDSGVPMAVLRAYFDQITGERKPPREILPLLEAFADRYARLVEGKGIPEFVLRTYFDQRISIRLRMSEDRLAKSCRS